MLVDEFITVIEPQLFALDVAYCHAGCQGFW